jgi:archaellum component FlaG (FlaF/FlaG flagellin family)
MRLHPVAIVLVVLGLSGCASASGDVVHFQPQPGQQVTANGQDSLIESRGRQTVVSVRPFNQPFVNRRPEYVIGIKNVTSRPVQFVINNVQVTQVIDGNPKQLKTYSVDELRNEEALAQVGDEILAGTLAGFSDALTNDASLGNQIVENHANARQQVLQELDQLTLKDHVLSPGEMYAGKLYIEPPSANKAGLKIYAIALTVGSDQHEIIVMQGK